VLLWTLQMPGWKEAVPGQHLVWEHWRVFRKSVAVLLWHMPRPGGWLCVWLRRGLLWSNVSWTPRYHLSSCQHDGTTCHRQLCTRPFVWVPLSNIVELCITYSLWYLDHVTKKGFDTTPWTSQAHWMRTIEQNVQQFNMGLHSAYQINPTGESLWEQLCWTDMQNDDYYDDSYVSESSQVLSELWDVTCHVGSHLPHNTSEHTLP